MKKSILVVAILMTVALIGQTAVASAQEPPATW